MTIAISLETGSAGMTSFKKCPACNAVKSILHLKYYRLGLEVPRTDSVIS